MKKKQKKYINLLFPSFFYTNSNVKCKRSDRVMSFVKIVAIEVRAGKREK